MQVVEYVAEVVDPLQPSPALYEIVISEPEQGRTAKKSAAAKQRIGTGLTLPVQALETKEALVHSEGQCLVPSGDVHGKRQLKTGAAVKTSEGRHLMVTPLWFQRTALGDSSGAGFRSVTRGHSTPYRDRSRMQRSHSDATSACSAAFFKCGSEPGSIT